MLRFRLASSASSCLIALAAISLIDSVGAGLGTRPVGGADELIGRLGGRVGGRGGGGVGVVGRRGGLRMRGLFSVGRPRGHFRTSRGCPRHRTIRRCAVCS